jgi:cobyrinic acid a,c-diamide synthase
MTARVVIAGTSSGAGKTTIASGLIGALRAQGNVVQGFKVGPDFIDPSYHALASGRPGRNLDVFLSGESLIAPLFRHGATGADMAVIEGVMGMFDGASGSSERASTAHVAKLLDAPVVLVIDASAMARSAAAVIHGFRTFDPAVRLAGVIFNRVGSEGHAELLCEAMMSLPGEPLPVLGALQQSDAIDTPERHLGLVPAGERLAHAEDSLAAMAQAVAAAVDLDAVTRVAQSAPKLPGAIWDPEALTAEALTAEALAAGAVTEKRAIARKTVEAPVRIAIARGPAFSFHYEENLELLRAAGAELASFDPIVDARLPSKTGALILAGGFPEVFGSELAGNASLRHNIKAFAATGRPVLAECGGLLYLAQELDSQPMCGVLPLRGTMDGAMTLGYRDATAATATPWLAAGTEVRGHEFHFSRIEPVANTTGNPAWTLRARGIERPEGFVSGAVQASYMHMHWSAHPQIPARFVAAAAAKAPERR